MPEFPASDIYTIVPKYVFWKRLFNIQNETTFFDGNNNQLVEAFTLISS